MFKIFIFISDPGWNQNQLHNTPDNYNYFEMIKDYYLVQMNIYVIDLWDLYKM